MNLKKGTAEELKKILERDYKTSITDDQANDLGVSLLRLSRLALVGLARKMESEK